MLKLIKEDLSTYRGDWMRPGFQALATHRFGNWALALKFRPIRWPLVYVAKAMFILTRNFYGIELPFSAKIGRGVIIEHQHGIVIHGLSTIGDNCILRQGVTLGVKDMKTLDKAPTLGRGVELGAGAKILGGVTVGDGARIGANAVVVTDIPAGTTAVGMPARVIDKKPVQRYLFDRQIS